MTSPYPQVADAADSPTPVSTQAGLSADQASFLVSVLQVEVDTFTDSDGHWGGYAAGCQTAINLLRGMTG